MLKNFFQNLFNRKAAAGVSLPLSGIIGWVLSHFVDAATASSAAGVIASGVTTLFHLLYKPQGAQSHGKTKT